MTACKRCGGLGQLPEYRSHLAGTCFRCHGTGTHQPPTEEQKNHWRRRAAEKKAIKEAYETWTANQPKETP